MSKTLTVTISGSFKASDGEIESFDKVTGIIPALDEDKATQMIIKRYAIIWLAQAKKLDRDGKPTDEQRYKRVQRVRQVFVDSIDENEANPKANLSYVGKNILEMNFEELQDLAAACDLSAIPLYKVSSLQHARRVAWSEYARKVLKLEGPEFSFKTSNFNPSRHEAIIADGNIRRHDGDKVSLEESIDMERLGMKVKNETDSSRSRMTLDQLKAIADEKKIQYHKSIGYEQLWKKVYSQAA